MLDGLVDRLGDVVRAELHHQADEGSAGARHLLDRSDTRSRATVRVEVVGPLRVLVDGRPIEHPALRRARVREVLAILCVERTVSRERLMSLLWPDHDLRRAAHNLRVTLTYLRRLLHQAGTGTEAPLRVEHQRLQLTATDRFSVDLWELRALLAGPRDEAGLTRAVALWRGEPVADLRSLDEAPGAGEGLALQLADAALTLAERRLAEGNIPATLALVDRARTASPYSERAARIAVAACLQQGDSACLTDAVARLRALLDDLGVEPEPATRVLLGCVARSGRLTRR